MAERRPAGYPKLKNYKPSRFKRQMGRQEVLAASLAGAVDPGHLRNRQT